MATYIMLASFTDQGIRSVRETTARAEAFREMAKKFGVTAKEIYWTLGRYDLTAVIESPDESAVTAVALALGSAGNVRTQLMRAFTASEMKGILGKLNQKAASPKKPAVPA